MDVIFVVNVHLFKVAMRVTRGEYAERVGAKLAVALYLLAMVTVIIGVDVLFLRHHLWSRLAVNVGVIVVFASVYVAFFRRP